MYPGLIIFFKICFTSVFKIQIYYNLIDIPILFSTGQRMMEKIIQRRNEKSDISDLQITGYIDPTNPDYIVHGLHICNSCGEIRPEQKVQGTNNSNNKCGYDKEHFSTHL